MDIQELPSLLISNRFSVQSRAITYFSSIFKSDPSKIYTNFHLFLPFFDYLLNEQESQIINIQIFNRIIIQTLNPIWPKLSTDSKVSILQYFESYVEKVNHANAYTLPIIENNTIDNFILSLTKSSTEPQLIPYIKHINSKINYSPYDNSTQSKYISESSQSNLPSNPFQNISSVVLENNFFTDALGANMWKTNSSKIENEVSMNAHSGSRQMVPPKFTETKLEGYAMKRAGEDSNSFQPRYFELFIDHSTPYGDKCLIWRDFAPSQAPNGKPSTINGALVIASSTPIEVKDHYVTISPYNAKEYKFFFGPMNDPKLNPVLPYSDFVLAVTGKLPTS